MTHTSDRSRPAAEAEHQLSTSDRARIGAASGGGGDVGRTPTGSLLSRSNTATSAGRQNKSHNSAIERVTTPSMANARWSRLSLISTELNPTTSTIVVMIIPVPTSALDSVSEEEVQKALERVIEERHSTSLVIAHRLASIQNAHKIVVLEMGRFVEEGTAHELMQRPDSVYRRLALAQGAHQSQ